MTIEKMLLAQIINHKIESLNDYLDEFNNHTSELVKDQRFSNTHSIDNSSILTEAIVMAKNAFENVIIIEIDRLKGEFESL